jgi:hypothetical protein
MAETTDCVQEIIPLQPRAEASEKTRQQVIDEVKNETPGSTRSSQPSNGRVI